MRHLLPALLLLLATGCSAGAPTAGTQATPSGQNTAGLATGSASTATATAPPVDTATPALAANQFANPVLDQDFADPDTLKVSDTWYAYATNTGSANIQVAKSADLVQWQVLPDALPVLPAWAQPGDTWAPEVTTSGDGKSYVMYFAARRAGASFECIGVATGSRPEGPFKSPSATPFICPEAEGGAIDPTAFAGEDGTRYVLWKNDGNCCGATTWIYLQKVSPDGLTLLGTPTQLIKDDQDWEGVVVEAPTLWKHAGKYFLFYSANDYRTFKYAIGYAVADNILGPYRKPLPGPLVMSSTARPPIIGPGGQDVVLDKQGHTWLVYHTWDPTVSYRNLNIDPLTWDGDKPIVKPSRQPETRP